MATRQKSTFDDRIKEYIDSPLMIQRLRCEDSVSTLIRGNFGSYRTIAEIKSAEVVGECSCPSELVPCKHIHALRATWNKNPASFFNFDTWAAELPKESKATLVEAIRNMILHSPSLLSVFGVSGFEIDESQRNDYYD
jgi:hypothetical protein